MTEHYPCRVCALEVEDDDKSVQCDLCDRWIHIKCAEINHQKYEKLKKDPLAWYCADCTTETPFSTLSNKDFKDFSLFNNRSTTFANLTKIEQRN